MDDTILNFNYPTDTPKIIKVIGVGGGGGNAVTHMYRRAYTMLHSCYVIRIIKP